MKIDWNKTGIYLRTGYTDMRKQINGLAIIVQQEFKMNPFNGDLYIFCGANKRILKLLYWERNGFCLWIKKLQGPDRFPWPLSASEARKISGEELEMLLSGIDFFHAHQELEYKILV